MIVGRALLIIALGVCVCGIVTAVLGARRGRADLVASARRATYALALLAAGAMLVLELAYLRDDFSYALVASNSSTTTPLFYKATSMRSSQAGSLLLWLVILSALAALAVRVGRRRFAALVPYAHRGAPCGRGIPRGAARARGESVRSLDGHGRRGQRAAAVAALSRSRAHVWARYFAPAANDTIEESISHSTGATSSV